MTTQQIIEKLITITHQPALIFTTKVEEKLDSAYETLKLLASEENVTAGRISEHLDIKPSSVTQIIKKLEAAGTAQREKSQVDSRITFVSITDKGRESLKERQALAPTINEAIFTSFSEEELQQLNGYLERIMANMESPSFQEKIDEMFSNDKRWERFSKMSHHFSRAREHMMEHGNHEHWGPKHRPPFGKVRDRGEGFNPWKGGHD